MIKYETVLFIVLEKKDYLRVDGLVATLYDITVALAQRGQHVSWSQVVYVCSRNLTSLNAQPTDWARHAAFTGFCGGTPPLPPLHWTQPNQQTIVRDGPLADLNPEPAHHSSPRCKLYYCIVLSTVSRV